MNNSFLLINLYKWGGLKENEKKNCRNFCRYADDLQRRADNARNAILSFTIYYMDYRLSGESKN